MSTVNIYLSDSDVAMLIVPLLLATTQSKFVSGYMMKPRFLKRNTRNGCHILIVDCAKNFVKTGNNFTANFPDVFCCENKLRYFCPVWHILKQNLAYFDFVHLATLVFVTVTRESEVHGSLAFL